MALTLACALGCDEIRELVHVVSGGGLTPEERADTAFAAGIAHLAAGELDAAEAAFRRVLRETPEHQRAPLELASVYHRRGEDARALLELGTAELRLPNSVEVHSLRGEVLFGQGRYAPAARSFGLALGDAGTARDWSRLIESLARAREVEEARQQLEVLSELDVEVPHRAVLEGILAAMEGDGAGARRILEEAAEGADAPEPHAALGWFSIQRGDPITALDPLRRAVQLGGDFLTVRMLVEALVDSGEAEEAVGLIAPYTRERTRDPVAHAAHARALVGVGRYEAAMAAANDALRLDPRLPAALVARGAALDGAGDLDAAIVSYRAASHEAPGHAEAHRLLAGAYIRLGRTSDAVLTLERLVLLDPSDRRGAIALLELCTDNPVHAQRGLRLVDRLLENDPGDRRLLELRRRLQSVAAADRSRRRPARPPRDPTPEVIRSR